jgi:hypothetical protein
MSKHSQTSLVSQFQTQQSNNTSANKNEHKHEGKDQSEIMMGSLKDLNNPNAPPYRKDRLFDNLAKGSRHSSQMIPRYSEFRLGHGDPLMQAVMKHWPVIALPHGSPERSPRKVLDVYVNKEIHLKEQGSPLCGPGMNDVVHLSTGDILTIPCLPNVDHLLINDPHEKNE